MQDIGKILLLIALFVALAGAILYFFGDKLNGLGNLPGDIRIVKENFSFYMPLTTMIVISLLITIILWIVRKFF